MALFFVQSVVSGGESSVSECHDWRCWPGVATRPRTVYPQTWSRKLVLWSFIALHALNLTASITLHLVFLLLKRLLFLRLMLVIVHAERWTFEIFFQF